MPTIEPRGPRHSLQFNPQETMMSLIHPPTVIEPRHSPQFKFSQKMTTVL